jgi:hypothetical protein
MENNVNVIKKDIEHGTMNKELEVSQKIEDYLLKLVGKEVVSWERIVFLTNKVLLGSMFLLLIQRGDFLTV